MESMTAEQRKAHRQEQIERRDTLVAKVKELRDQGFMYREIAKELCMSESSIRALDMEGRKK